nr:uncharacterized protein LOC129255640 [Lytechinus pictus]
MQLPGFEPISVEKRTALADVIISGTVLRVHRHQRAWDSTYPANVLVADVYKGYELFDNATSLPEDEIQAEYRSYYPHVYRIDRFGDQRLCWDDVIPGKNYVFYLTTNPSPRDMEVASDAGGVVDVSRMMTKEGLKLEASHDSVSGASINYDVKTEENILKILGWRPWASWSSCSKECGGGHQTRRRVCVRDVPNACEGDAKQKRRCNVFDCSDEKDMKKILHLDDFPPGVRRAPSRWTAYRITHQARTIRAPTSSIYGKSFPHQFAVLLTVKPKVTLRKNRGDPYALLFTDADGSIKFGIKLAKTPSIVYSQLDGTLKELNFTDYVLDRSWHYMAFSVNKHTVTLIANCKEVFTLNIDRSDRAMIDATGTTSIGSGYRSVNYAYFEGDIDQLIIVNDTSIAELQCLSQERRFPDLLNIASTAPPSSSVNGMDASIDIGLVYDNLFDPFLFMDPETTTSMPMDTTFPSFSEMEVTEDEMDGASVSPTSSPTTTQKVTQKIMTQRPRTPTPALTKLTVKLDNGAFEINQSNSDVIHDIMEPESVSFVYFEDNNHATVEPVSDDGDRTIPSRSDATINRANNSKYWTITPTTPTSKRGPSAYSQVKVLPTTITEPPTRAMTTPTTTRKPTTVPSTTKATTTRTTTPATTKPPSTTTTKATITSVSKISTRTITTTLSTTSTMSMKSTSEMNDILGDVEVDNNSERPLNDGLIPAPPGDALSPVAPATVQRPSIYQHGRPIDENSNWSTWSTCSRTCGTGTRYRFSVCSKDSNLPDCLNGRGIAAQHKSCRHNNDCKGVLRWSEWGSCTRTCGSGFETRVAICRDIDSHENCTKVGQLMVERRMCEGLSECPHYCIGGCLNGGTCMPEGVCHCPSGYAGRMCERELCQHSCKNGGRCVGKDKCLCPYGHLPPFCEPLCNPPCQNNGRCIHPGRCICPKGYTGPACSKPICEDGCKNGGECIAPDRCHCRTGYSGSDCSKPECSPPCENGGVCLRAGFCKCQTGYRGMQCQIGYCRRSCLNGGRCSGPDTCTCPRGYTGSLCQQSKCPDGCPGYSQCIGPNKCSSYGRHVVSSSTSTNRRQWCPLQSYVEMYTLTYIKPAIQKYRVRCGAYGLQTCESSRIIYQVGYRQSRRTAYRCAPYG